MTKKFGRGSAPGRSRSAEDRTGSFKKGHKKIGGRQKGTPNRISSDFKRTLLEVADRVGSNGAGKQGVVGYFRFIARRHPAIFAAILGRCLPIEEAELESHEAELESARRRRILADQFSKSLENLMRVQEAYFSRVQNEFPPRPSTIDGTHANTTQSFAGETTLGDVEDSVETSAAAAHAEPQDELQQRLSRIDDSIRLATRTKTRMPLRPSTTITLQTMMGVDSYEDMMAALELLVMTPPETSRTRKLPRPSPGELPDALSDTLLNEPIDHEDLVDGLAHLAVTAPAAFCKMLAAVHLAPPRPPRSNLAQRPPTF